MSACTTETSETACGFVVEFADIIEKKEFNKADKENEYGTNNGGWENSELRKYINTTLFDYFSTELKSVISSTKVVSGHGGTDTQNYQTYDNLYLLSSEEIYGDFSYSNNSNYDTSTGTSRQLDYYKNVKVTMNNFESTKKIYNGNYLAWWLRSARNSNSNAFIHVRQNGEWGSNSANIPFGVSPAFRIA